MNEEPDVASLWKGRVLFCIEHEPATNPKYEVQPIHEASLLLEKARSYYENTTFYVNFEADSIIMTPKESQSYSL